MMERGHSHEGVGHVVVPGTFDPITFGHLDVIERACRLFTHVTIAVASSQGKNGVGTTFSLDERVDMCAEAVAARGLDGCVDVRPFEGLLVDFCHEVCAGAVVKGLRAMTDFEYELQQAELNARMAPDIESVFVMSGSEYGFVSSSIVRELASLGSDVSFLVPPNVDTALKERFAPATP